MFVVSKNQAKHHANSLHKFLAEKGLPIAASDALNAIARMAGFNDWNAMADQYKPEAVEALLGDFEQSHVHDASDCELRSEETGGGGFGEECMVQVASGFWLVTAAYPNEVDYVRVCDPLGREVSYWSIDELTEAADEVMGAIMGALNRGRSDIKPDPLNPDADKLVVSNRVKKEPRSNSPAKVVIAAKPTSFEPLDAAPAANLLFSYSLAEDGAAIALGHTFLGAGFDGRGVEVHVFQRLTLAQYCQEST